MIFTAHTLVFHQHEAHSFAPGDTVPDWAKDKVGPHITADPEATPATTEPAAQTPAEDHPTPPTDDAEVEPAEEEQEDPAEDTDDDQPDFTQPAPRRRTSARRKG